MRHLDLQTADQFTETLERLIGSSSRITYREMVYDKKGVPMDSRLEEAATWQGMIKRMSDDKQQLYVVVALDRESGRDLLLPITSLGHLPGIVYVVKGNTIRFHGEYVDKDTTCWLVFS